MAFLSEYWQDIVWVGGGIFLIIIVLVLFMKRGSDLGSRPISAANADELRRVLNVGSKGNQRHLIITHPDYAVLKTIDKALHGHEHINSIYLESNQQPVTGQDTTGQQKVLKILHWTKYSDALKEEITAIASKKYNSETADKLNITVA